MLAHFLYCCLSAEWIATENNNYGFFKVVRSPGKAKGPTPSKINAFSLKRTLDDLVRPWCVRHLPCKELGLETVRD
jgi:hypothetical protein